MKKIQKKILLALFQQYNATLNSTERSKLFWALRVLIFD